MAGERGGASDRNGTVTIPRRTSGGVAPMSFAQELVWSLDNATPGLTAYNVPRALRLRGTLDVAALRSALDALVERHEILRTTYAADERGQVQVVNPHQPFVLPVDDLAGVPEAGRPAAAEQRFLAEALTPFNLATDVLLRARLIEFAPDDHVLLLLSHHIASDGWSKGVMYREISEAYAAFADGRAPSVPPLPLQYADYSAWQRREVEGGSLAPQLEYWKGRLVSPLPSLDLPTDFPRPAAQSFQGAREAIVLPSELAAGLRDLGMDHGATLYMVLLAAYQTVLHRYSGQDDLITGSPVAGRGDSNVEGLIGFFANMLAMRTSFAGDPTFGELLERISEHAAEAYEHQDVPFEKLVLELRDEDATPSHTPLFRHVLTMEDTLPDELRLGDVSVETLAADFGMAKFDLALLVAEQTDGLRLALWYRTDLFTRGYAERFLGHVRTVLEEAIANPALRVAAIPLLTSTERMELGSWNRTAVDEGSSATLADLFERQAARAPGSLAVVGPHVSAPAGGIVVTTVPLTYGELNARANQLAHHLRALGVGPDVPVGLMLGFSVDAVIGLVGILKAGGAYMPLAVEAPAARLAQQIGESGATIVVTNGILAERLPSNITAVAIDRPSDEAALAALPTDNPVAVASLSSLAYILFTSGSTGVPKGVAVTNANAVHYARAVSRVLADSAPGQTGDGFTSLQGLRFGLVSTLAADLGNTSVLPSLLGGGALHVLAKDVTTDAARFAEYVAANELDVLKITPNHLAALAFGRTGAELAAVLPRKWLVLGGEALRIDVARVLASAGKARVLNHYGPTETTVGALTFEVRADALTAAEAMGAQTVPVGSPLANTHVYVIDAAGNEQPVGLPGELLIGGAGVASGYFHRPELTQERFVDFRGERVYRTGDRVRRLADGTVEFLGRADDQVKVRGFRVELGEIEHLLRSHPGVAEGVVVLRAIDDGDASLVAYAVARPSGYAVSHGDRPTPEKLGEWFAAQLPDYMVPSAVVMLDAMPLTANGKVDRARLSAPESSGGKAVDRFVVPRTPTEESVAKIWREVLKRDHVGVTESFLDLGGHSLLAIRVLGRISKEMGVRLALRALFETPTVEQIAAIIDEEQRQRFADAALREALAAVENMTDAEVAQSLGAERAPTDVP